MLITAPQFASVPHAMVTAARDWLVTQKRTVVSPTRVPDPRMSAARPSACTVLTLRPDTTANTPLLTERLVQFGPSERLFGIVTEPPHDERRRRAVILINSGVAHHIGASGLYVSLARLWGSRGYVVLRMDLAGIGDSGTMPGKPDDELFPDSAIDDIRTALEFLKATYGVGDTTLAGLCSGAYHALRAAVAGIAVHRILMINPQNFFWKPGRSITDIQEAELVARPVPQRKKMLSLAEWRRVARGEVNVWRAVQIPSRSALLKFNAWSREAARRLKIRLPNDLGRDLETIGALGVGIVFVFSRGEPGIDLLKLQGGSALARLGDRCRIHLFEGGDHVFTQRPDRFALEQVLSKELFMRSERRS